MWRTQRCSPHRQHRQLTFLVQEELVEAQPAGLLPDEAVHVVRAVVVHGDGVLQGLDARLQAEGHLGVAYRMPVGGGGGRDSRGDSF